MLSLIVAGEAIFGLPFHITRFFRPTVLEVFGLTNTELGIAQAVYGVWAMIAYFPGGAIADRFNPRTLLMASLLTTAAGGFLFATLPDLGTLSLLFGFWGITTILLFWASLIRVTREWGGNNGQGKAYGILDGGRGLLSAVLATAAVLLFSLFFPDDPAMATTAERADALTNVIYVYTWATIAAAVVVWFGVPKESSSSSAERQLEGSAWARISQVVRRPSIWMQATIVICAYVAFKGLDNLSLFAVQAYGMNEVEGAQLSSLSAWVRPAAAVGAGFLGDRFRSSRVMHACFVILIASNLNFAVSTPNPSATWVLFLNVIISCVAIFGLRGVYFALFEEAKIPLGITGTAIGLVSVIGYTPDIFVGPIAGWLLDTYPGATGHQYLYLCLAGTAAVGLVASVTFSMLTRRDRAEVMAAA